MPTHETVIVRGDVTIDEMAIIEPYAIIDGPAWIGSHAFIGAHACIGAPAQHHGSYPAPTDAPHKPRGVRVEAHACVREYATIHQGAVSETRVGANTLLMAGCHIAHDCVIEEGVTMGSFSILGGFTLIDRGATFGQGVVTHPWTLVGEAAMVGLNSSVVKDVEPFAKVAGSPARLLGTNTHRAPDLPSEYQDAILSADVWDRWSRLADQREQLRVAWRQLTE